jgi:hypothetical protein
MVDTRYLNHSFLDFIIARKFSDRMIWVNRSFFIIVVSTHPICQLCVIIKLCYVLENVYCRLFHQEFTKSTIATETIILPKLSLNPPPLIPPPHPLNKPCSDWNVLLPTNYVQCALKSDVKLIFRV